MNSTPPVSIACRPASVIVSRRKLRVRPPAFTISGLAVVLAMPNDGQRYLTVGLPTGGDATTLLGVFKIPSDRSSYRSTLERGSGQTERIVRPDVAISIPRITGHVMSPCIVVHSVSLGHRFRSRLGKSRRNDDDADSDEDNKGFH
jgi:hypothetical protein